MNNIIKTIFVFLFVFFLALYFSKYNSNLYESEVQLTNQAIIQYEKDLKAGKVIDSKNYVLPKNNYSNKATRIGVNASNLIDYIFRRFLSSLKKYISKY